MWRGCLPPQLVGHHRGIDRIASVVARAAALVDHIESDRHLQVEALALACYLDYPMYDWLYLALARRGAPFAKG